MPYKEKTKQQAYQAQWHQQNQKAVEATRQRRIRNRQYVYELLQRSQCVDCSNNDWRVLEFDHLSDKDGTISRGLRDWGLERIKKEIAKCDIVCANCHRIRTYKRNGARVMVNSGSIPETRLSCSD